MTRFGGPEDPDEFLGAFDPEGEHSDRMSDSVESVLDGLLEVFRPGDIPEESAAQRRRVEAPAYKADLREIRDRLEDLGAIDLDEITTRTLRRFPELVEVPDLIDDLHYEAYRKKRIDTKSPYISVSVNDIINELKFLKKENHSVEELRNKQTLMALYFLRTLKVEEYDIFLMMQKPHDRFLLRSVYRMLKERPMSDYVNKVKEIRKEIDEPVPLAVFAWVAVKWLGTIYKEHQEFGLSGSPDPTQRSWYGLRMAELKRTRAFAKPLADYLEANKPAN